MEVNMFYDNQSFESCCCKDCGTTNEEDFKDSVTDDWCDDCFDKSYDEWIEKEDTSYDEWAKQHKKRNA